MAGKWFSCAVLGVAMLATASLQAQILGTLHNFNGAPDGALPIGGVVRIEGSFYGTTANGGADSPAGTVFKVDLKGNKTTLHSFSGPPDGYVPLAGLIKDSDGNLYGTTAYGGGTGNGGAGWGTVFQLTPPAIPGGAWTESVLYSFKGGNDGGLPQANLLSTSGVLYGTAYTGGIAACGPLGTDGCGVVFELKQKAGGGAWKETVLHTFTGGADGGLSSAPLVIKGGVLYGTTSQVDSFYQGNNGCSWGCGTVFELAPPAVTGAAWTETVLYHFQPAPTPPGYSYDGSAPVGGVVFGPHGALYGATSYGGPFATGTIFELAPPAAPGGTWTESILYEIEFDAATGGYTSFPSTPLAGLTVGKNGVLYGTTTGDAGMVFQLKP